jgi:Alr-MurF fusion protein
MIFSANMESKNNVYYSLTLKIAFISGEISFKSLNLLKDYIMDYNIRQLVKILDATPSGSSDMQIQHLEFDSRKIIDPSHCLFVALISHRNNGHTYIQDAYQKGIRSFLISRKEQMKLKLHEFDRNSIFLAVDDTLKAIQKLAAHHLNMFDIPVIAITGSNGKTIVKEWLYHILHPRIRMHKSPKSYNSQIGVPLSVLGLEKHHEMAIFEAGISEVAEMKNLVDILNPDAGIFTNIGWAHQAGFSSMQQKIEEKLLLFQSSSILLYCRDHYILHDVIQSQFEKGFFKNNIRFLTWGKHEKSDILLESFIVKNNTSNVSFRFQNKNYTFQIPFGDKASMENAMHVISYSLYKGISKDYLQERLSLLSPVQMRLELREGAHNSTIINDTYNSDIISLEIALDYLKKQQQHEEKIIILSDMLQSGMDGKELYSRIGELLRKAGVSELIAIGKMIKEHAEQLHMKNATFYQDTRQFLEKENTMRFNNSAILIKGAREFCFEKITAKLQKQVHKTLFELDLNALIHNVNVYRSLIRKSTRIMAMVKAFSYGSGTYEIASLLEYYNIDYLAVAYPDEGVLLREAGLKLPVVVMNPDEDSFNRIFDHNLEAEIYSIDLLVSLVSYVKDNPGTQVFPVHLKLDTGMHRLGLDASDIDYLLDTLKENPRIHVQSVFTHLAAADESEHDDFTNKQIGLFENMRKRISQSLTYTFLSHVLNSSGIVRFPKYQYDMVRLGIGMYGVDPTGIIQERLVHVGTLKTRVSQVKVLKKSESVGYSRKAVLDSDAQIAIVNAGYADGIPRMMGNGNAEFFINNTLVKTIGNISMDSMALDVTGLDVKRGDEVIIFGKVLPVTRMANNLDTIPYEVLTGISSRVKRIYHKE